MNLKNILSDVLITINKASAEVLRIYKTDFNVLIKKDLSPLTEADAVSHRIILEALQKFCWPIISEENIADIEITSSDYFWLVDPLDGTKEFINRNDEFTINIALIHNNRPILGVVAVPALDSVYYAAHNCGAYKVNQQNNVIRIKSSSCSKLSEATIAVSRSHLSQEDKEFIEKNNIKKVLPLGSALKYCYIAEGLVDLSVRFTPLMAWDIAASDIILQESDARVVDFSGENFCYTLNHAQHTLVNGLKAYNNQMVL